VRIGIGVNEWAQGLPSAFKNACKEMNIDHQSIDFSNIGEVDVTHLAPALLYLKPEAQELYRMFESQGVKVLNPVRAIEIADDKAATYQVLEELHLETTVIDLDLAQMRSAFLDSPTVYKRTHGGQGRWVRLARDASEIDAIYNEFVAEGPGRIVVQRYVEEAANQTIRVIVTGGRVLAATIRTATMDFRSNISVGGVQKRVQLIDNEPALAIAATEIIGLGHAGVDLIRTKTGTKVLEVNACPDFTSMKDLSDIDIAQEVIKTLLLK
jgi:ribosomal protein S6--L-glutamate ligase